MGKKVSILDTLLFWVEAKSDNSKCHSCKEIIYGTMFYPVLKMTEIKPEETTFNDFDLKMCADCYESKVS